MAEVKLFKNHSSVIINASKRCISITHASRATMLIICLHITGNGWCSGPRSERSLLSFTVTFKFMAFYVSEARINREPRYRPSRSLFAAEENRRPQSRDAIKPRGRHSIARVGRSIEKFQFVRPTVPA